MCRASLAPALSPGSRVQVTQPSAWREEGEPLGPGLAEARRISPSCGFWVGWVSPRHSFGFCRALSSLWHTFLISPPCPAVHKNSTVIPCYVSYVLIVSHILSTAPNSCCHLTLFHCLPI